MVEIDMETAPFSNRTTSWEAAQSIMEPPERVRARAERAVLRAILQAPDGLTCDEIETQLNMSHQTVSARIRGLVRKGGYIVDSGKVRKTRAGRNAIVWKESIP